MPILKSFPLPLGFKQNKTYFISATAILDDDTKAVFASQKRSVSCTNCTGVNLNYDFSSCSINFPVKNQTASTEYVNVKLSFYADSALTNLVTSIDSSVPDDLVSYYINDVSADTFWGESGYQLNSEEILNLTCYPALSSTTGLICGVVYYIKAEVAISSLSTGTNNRWEDLGTTTYKWVCNCTSVRWTDDQPTDIRDLIRWRSSANGGNDIRITTSSGNSLNPSVKYRGAKECLILFQDDRRTSGKYEIVASVQNKLPNETGFLTNREVFTNPPLYGENVSFDLDQYDRVFMACDTQITGQNNKLKSAINVHKCGYDPKLEVVSTTTITNESFVLTPFYVDTYVNRDVIQQIRVQNESVRYHITIDKTPVAVIKKCGVMFDIVGTSESIAVRAKNEDQLTWSAWSPFNPELGHYQMQFPWTLTSGNGIKTVSFQFATYTGLTSTITVNLVADYEEFNYTIDFYSAVDFSAELPKYNNLPIANFSSDTPTVYFKISPERKYLEEFSEHPNHGAPEFSVITQGGDIVNSTTTWVKEESGNEYFLGSFQVQSPHDGLAMVIPKFLNDCSSSAVAFSTPVDDYNIMESTKVTNQTMTRDKFGNIAYQITNRPSEDPYFVFGDPNYRLHQEN